MVLRHVCPVARRAFPAIAILLLPAVAVFARDTVGKRPLPDDAAQQKALEEIRQVYRQEFEKAKTGTEKLALAKKLLKQTAQWKGEAYCFALGREARDLAVQAADAETALQAIDWMAGVFQIDALEMKAGAIAKLARSARLSAQHQGLATSAADLIDEAIARDNYQAAGQLANVAIAAARKAKEGALAKEIAARKKKIDKAAQAYARLQSALVTLEKDPVDPDANLAAGEYSCFVKGDWAKGVPMLALGSNQALKALAVKELTEATSPDQQVALGDGWRDLVKAPGDLPREAPQTRAAWWYLKALPRLSGPASVAAEKRLSELVASGGGGSGSGLACRSEASRALLLAIYGGNAQSERAVEMGLKWLAAHQMPDGGWSFNHTLAPQCQGQCRQPGSSAEARNAATAMALLPLLAAGNTHMQGRYKTAVKNGLYFLISHIKRTPQGGSFWERGGQMYSHGLASIALCEAYAMTGDKSLHQPAQETINFICYAQDPAGGGWRYTPRQKGDTSVFGWQMTALKVGQMGELPIPPATLNKASLFLDSVQADGGANYGYTSPASGDSTTAIGLLCRMYLGWKRDHPALKRGIQRLGYTRPSGTSMYQDYYVTQLMWQYGGDPWKKWNAVMRDQLVNLQAKSGHETGSWYGTRDLGSRLGGRLYCTSLALMTLEVYYRYPAIGQE
jgi:hypothetical protein